MKQKPGKRIVSKEEQTYLDMKRFESRIAFQRLERFSWHLGRVCAYSAFPCFFVGALTVRSTEVPLLLIASTLLGLASFGSCELWMMSSRRHKEVVNFGTYTFDNIPLPEILVRPSAEPLQAQQSVLLRAAIETTDKHDEQLLSASAGEQE